jgi:murein DD-endopeptidase MepM/ murein hydrolase activator NlpD
MGRLRDSAIEVFLLAMIAAGSYSCGGGATQPSLPGCPTNYPPQESSPYVLPYPVGMTFVIGQGNCGSGSHAAGTVVQYAYDFLMPIGTTIIASRAGTVLLVEERYEDGTRQAGQENYVNVLQSDGSIAAYVHLTRDGALVDVGDRVKRGQTIGISGDSGSSTEPHLHFHVQSCSGCPTKPVTFRNTRPHPGGLEQGQSYTAESFDAS